MFRSFMNRLLKPAFLVLGVIAAPQAQVGWQTTRTTLNSHDFGGCLLARNSLKVKVSPAYLDVEEEVEIGAVGTVRSGNDPTSLEITGTFVLPPGSAVIGSLLWDGGRILEGKLLDRKRADSLYEKVVGRDSIIPPPRPRDPLIVEFVGNNTYRFKVFPVALNFSRRMRLRYQLPPKLGTEGFEIRLQAAIAPLFPASPNIPVAMVKGGGPDTILYAEGPVKRQLALPRNVFIAPANLGTYAAAPVRVLLVNPSEQVAAKTSFAAGQFSGYYLNLYAVIPQALLIPAGAATRTVSVTVRNAAKAYDFPIGCQATPAIQCGNLVFNGKSPAPWNDTLEWQAFDSQGRLLKKIQTWPRGLGNPGDTGIAVIWAGSAARFSEKQELPTGPVYGFVDVWASLLALEKDSLVGPRFLAFSDSGVPRIVNENLADVIPNYSGQMPGCCGTPVVPAKKTALNDVTEWRIEKGREGFLTLRIPGLAPGIQVELELFDLGGRRAGRWTLRAEPGSLRWTIGTLRSGTYLLKVRAVGFQGVKRIVL